jgi:WD40 repeat protein
MKSSQSLSVSLLLCAFALSFLLFTPAITTAQQNHEILRLGRGTAKMLDWRPDGEVLAVASSTGVWLLDADLNVTAHLFDQPVTTLAWSPDGEKLATSTIIEQSCTLQIWDVDAKQVLVESSECADKIPWKPDSQALAITSPFTQNVTLISTNGEIILKDVPGRAAAWSPDGERLAAINADILSVWNVVTGRKMLTTANQGYGDALLWTDGAILTLCSEHNASTYIVSMCHLNPRTGVKMDSKVLLWRHPGEWGDLGRLRWNTENNRFSFIASLSDGSVSSLAYLFNWSESPAYITTLASFTAWKPGTSMITIGRDNGLIQNVDPQTGTVLVEKDAFTAPVRSLAWSPDGERLASAGSGDRQAVHIWDVSSDSEIPALTLQPKIVSSLAWTPDGSELLTFGTNGVYASDIRAWDAIDGHPIRGIAQDLAPQRGVIAWNSDFTHKAIANGQQIRLPEEIDIRAALEVIHAICWSPDSSQIATLSANPDSSNFTIETWDTQTGERIASIQSGAVSGFDSALYWSSDSTRLGHSLRIGGKQEYTVWVYDAATGETVFTYDTPQWYAPKLAWRPDDRALAVEILTGVIFLDAQGGERVGEQIPMGYISALAWRPDGEWLAIGGLDGVVRVWDVAGIL